MNGPRPASHVGGLTHYWARFVKLIEQAVQATRTWSLAVGSTALG